MTADEKTGGTQLAEKKCIPCQGGTPPLEEDKAQDLLSELDGWEIGDDGHLGKSYEFEDFQGALDFVNQVGQLAEEQNHHPMIHFTYGRARIDLWTHKIDGLTESDFVLAAKIDRLGADA